MARPRKTTGTIGAPTIRKRISRRRGFVAITVRDRGPIGRGMKRAFNNASKVAWYDTALFFHTELRDRRFDKAHQQAAGFAKRKGEGLARVSKAFRRSYTGIKLSRFKHTLALVFTGETRKAMRQASISSTANKGKAAYRGASKFSFKHPKSRIRMMDEFRRLLDDEIQQLAKVYDKSLDTNWPDP